MKFSLKIINNKLKVKCITIPINKWVAKRTVVLPLIILTYIKWQTRYRHLPCSNRFLLLYQRTQWPMRCAASASSRWARCGSSNSTFQSIHSRLRRSLDGSTMASTNSLKWSLGFQTMIATCCKSNTRRLSHRSSKSCRTKLLHLKVSSYLARKPWRH